MAFNNEVDFDLLWRYFVRGWTFSKTRITETYDYEDFLHDRPGEAIELLVMNPEGKVEFCAAEPVVGTGTGRHDCVLCS